MNTPKEQAHVYMLNRQAHPNEPPPSPERIREIPGWKMLPMMLKPQASIFGKTIK